ncbi:MAG: hypothetical protein ABIT08_03415 [Bacteroidia bacterium]
MDIKHYLMLLCSIFALYLAGHIIFRIAKLKSPSEIHFNFFLKLVAGIIVFFVIYSIMITRFTTVNLSFIIIAAVSWYLLKKENLFDEKRKLFRLNFNSSILLLVFEILVTGTWWYIWTDHYYWSIPYNLPHKDIIYYSSIAEFFNKTHQENWFTSINLFDPNLQGTSPYHYFEIWITAGYAKVFNVLPLIAYIKLAMPLLLTASSIGIMALFKIYFKHNYFNLLLPALVFLHGMYFSDFLTEIDAFVYNPVSYPKYITVYLMLIVALLFFIKNKNIFFLALLCIPVMSISCTAGIFGSLVLFALINLFVKNKAIEKKTCYFIIVSVFTLFAFIMGFYSVTGVKQKNLEDTFSIAAIFSNWHTPINVMGATTLQFLYLYSAYVVILILLLLLKKDFFADKTVRYWMLMMGLIYATTLVTWAILFQMNNSFQLFQNLAIPALSVTLIFIFINAAAYLKEKKMRYYYLLLLFIFIHSGWILANSYNSNFSFGNYTSKFSEHYVNNIKQAINDKPLNPMGVFFMDSSDYTLQWASKVTNFYTLGDYLKLLEPGYFTISLTPYDTPLNTASKKAYNFDKLLVETSVFYKFTEKLRKNNPVKSVSDSQIDFIKSYKINYGVASKKAKLSPQMESIIDRQFVDEKTGERFILFKN